MKQQQPSCCKTYDQTKVNQDWAWWCHHNELLACYWFHVWWCQNIIILALISCLMVSFFLVFPVLSVMYLQGVYHPNIHLIFHFDCGLPQFPFFLFILCFNFWRLDSEILFVLKSTAKALCANLFSDRILITVVVTITGFYQKEFFLMIVARLSQAIWSAGGSVLFTIQYIVHWSKYGLRRKHFDLMQWSDKNKQPGWRYTCDCPS